MNNTSTMTLTILGVLSAASLLIDRSVAADFDKAARATPIPIGTNDTAQPTATDRSSNISIPSTSVVTPTTTPTTKKATTPGVTQSLNPQPLPPKSIQIQPLSPAIAPALNPQPLPPKTSATQKLSPGISTSLNPQPLPPKLTAPAAQSSVNGNNLFNTNDAAIIIVSGKSTTAGNLKREIQADLSRLSGPPVVFRTLTRKTSAISMQATAVAKSTHAALPSSGLNKNAQVTQLAKTGSIQQILNYCKQHPPEITRIQGHFTSGAAVTITGLCFGDTTGAVEILGQFPGGKLQATFSQWQDDSIVAVLPSLRGVPDSTVAVTVVRAPDHARSPAQQSSFIAARERVEVPVGLWAPNGAVDKTDVMQGGGNIFGGFSVVGVGGSQDSKFNLKINPQCALDNMEIPTTVGRVNAVTGFDVGPLNEAAINVNFTSTCTTKTINYVVASESTTWCRIAFQLRTWANCPAGLTP